MTILDEVIYFFIFFWLANGLSCFVGFVYGINRKIGLLLLALGIFAVVSLVFIAIMGIANDPSSFEWSWGSGIAGFVSAYTAPELFGMFKRKAQKLLGDK